MKRQILYLLLTVVLVAAQPALNNAGTACAQQFLVVETAEGREVLQADEVESITVERDTVFYDHLLPAAIAADPATQIFGQALQLTGLADSLTAFVDDTYPEMTDKERIRWFYSFNVSNYMEIPIVRRRSFTAFVEPDSIFASHGIRSLTDLEAYARRIYDEAFPEDKGISDPADRRHPLNRFVAYHLLPFGSTYDELTPNPIMFYRRLADVSDWYQTLLPCGSLKFSRPRGEEEGIYLNRRGIASDPDPYGLKVRGARIIPSKSGEWTQTASNGAYYYIDDLLAYDLTTQRETLNERWRISALSLSPDFMTHGIRALTPLDGTLNFDYDRVFISSYLDNYIVADSSYVGVLLPRKYYWNYETDISFQAIEHPEQGRCDLTLALPALPEGDYELRFGTTMYARSPRVRFSLDGVLLADSVDFQNINDKQLEERIGWKDYTTDSAEVYVRREMRSRGWMRGPKERALCTIGAGAQYDEPTSANSWPMSSIARNARSVVGRFHSDGRRAKQLRIESIPYTNEEMEQRGVVNGSYLGGSYYSEPIKLDYIELCPVWIADNEEIPED